MRVSEYWTQRLRFRHFGSSTKEHPLSNRLTVVHGFDRQLSLTEAEVLSV